MKIDNQYNVAKDKELCFCCFGDNHGAKGCPRQRKQGIDGCEKTHNTFLLLSDKLRKSSRLPRQGVNLTSNEESVGELMNIDIESNSWDNMDS